MTPSPDAIFRALPAYEAMPRDVIERLESSIARLEAGTTVAPAADAPAEPWPEDSAALFYLVWLLRGKVLALPRASKRIGFSGSH